MNAYRCMVMVAGLLACVGIGSVAWAEPLSQATHPEAIRQYDPYTLDIYWENDGGPLKRNSPRDQYYTNGVALSLAHRPGWAERLAPYMPFADDFGPARTAAGYTAGQLMFTPRDIEPEALQADDRPYAGYLFGGVYWQRANEHTLDHFQMDIGIVGPSSMADDAQDFVHRFSDAPDPGGWRHQLRDEPTIQFYVRKKWRENLASVAVGEGTLDLQWVPKLGVAVGTVYRHAEAGSMLRFGGNLPDDFGPGRVRDVASQTGDPGRGWGAYVFVGVEGQVVEHNLFLAGNTWKSSHSVRHRPLVGKARVGGAIQYRSDSWATQLAYSQIYQTDVFYGQSDGHEYGSITLSLTYAF